MDTEQGDVRGLDGCVRGIDDAGRGEGLDDADGAEVFGVDLHRLGDCLQHGRMHAGELAALDQRGAGSGSAGLDRGGHGCHVAGDGDKEFARTDAARQQKLDGRSFYHDVFDLVAGGDAGEFDESYRLNIRHEMGSFRAS